MSDKPTSKEVLTLIAEWIDAKKEAVALPKVVEFPRWPVGMFGLHDFDGISDRDDGDEQPTISTVDQKLMRAQTALELFIAGKVEEVLQSIINQNNTEARRPSSGHELYPERG